MPTFAPVRALSRGLNLLEIISQKKSLTLAQITKESGLSHATTVRLVETLVGQGYVFRDPQSGAYSVSGRTLLLSSGYDAFQRLNSLAEPALTRFHRQVGWPLNLAMFDRDAMVIVHTNRRRNAFALDISVGARSPLLVTGIGRAYLAHCDKDDVDEILSRLKGSSNRWDSGAGNPNAVKKQLAQVRKDGYALSSRQYVKDVYDDAIWALAVPIFVNDRPYACVSALILRNTADENSAKPIVKQLQTLADEIGAIVQKDLA